MAGDEQIPVPSQLTFRQLSLLAEGLQLSLVRGRLAREGDERLARQLADVEKKLGKARSDLARVVDEQRAELEALAERSTEELDDQLARRGQTLERMAGDRMAALEFAVDEARRNLEAARATL